MISKVIVPMAGLGDRMRPITSLIPKESLPIGLLPAIDFILEEIIASSLSHVIFVTSKKKQTLNEYVQLYLSKRKSGLTTDFVFQEKPVGLGNAILKCRSLIGLDSHFAIILPDNIFLTEGLSIIADLINLYEETRTTCVSIAAIQPEEVSKRAVVEISGLSNQGVARIKSIVDKPEASNTDCLFAISGRYIVANEIFSFIENKRSDKKEIEFTDALIKYLEHFVVDSKLFTHAKYDIGSPSGYYAAFCDFLKMKALS